MQMRLVMLVVSVSYYICKCECFHSSHVCWFMVVSSLEFTGRLQLQRPVGKHEVGVYLPLLAGLLCCLSLLTCDLVVRFSRSYAPRPHRVHPDYVKTDNLSRFKLGVGVHVLKRYLSKLSPRHHTLKNSHISSFPPSSAPSALVLTWSIVVRSALLCSFPVISIPSQRKKTTSKSAPCVQEGNSRESFQKAFFLLFDFINFVNHGQCHHQLMTTTCFSLKMQEYLVFWSIIHFIGWKSWTL